MTPPSVYMVSGDGIGWAIDEDRRLTQQSMEGLVRWVNCPDDAHVIHACWWEPLADLPAAALTGKAVICHMDDAVGMHLGKPHFQLALARTTHWLVQNRATLAQMPYIADDVTFIPYAVDVDRYHRPTQPPGPVVARALAALPADAYVIANFQRDTLGEPLSRGHIFPKLKKGPDLFVEILAELRARGAPVVALLSGPRRHWVRRQLAERAVPVVYAGLADDSSTPADDNAAMIEGVTPDQLALLYKRCNLYLTVSRAEGGPRGVLEAAAAGAPQLSTPCGLAPDLLAPECLYTDAIQAVEMILDDIAIGSLRRWTDAHLAALRANHTIAANRPRWAALYARLAAAGPRAAPSRPPVVSVRDRPRRIGLWHDFRPPPWGGGNQFMLALEAEAERQGLEVTVNGDGPPATAHLIQSVWFDPVKLRAIVKRDNSRVVHRVDGPLSLIRRTKEALELDRLCYAVNNELAAATGVQSWYMLQATRQLGFRPVRPVLITNACDPAIFHPHTPTASGPVRRPRPGEPLRIIATSWSDNPGKGGAIYEWIDKNLDHSRYQFTFAGNVAAPLKNCRLVPPVPSAELADLLRQHDAYLTASRGDPCSNALIEALNCGLPALYFDSGGHPELVGFGGLPFSRPEQIPELLDRLDRHLDAYRRLIVTEPIAKVCNKYLQLLLGDRTYAQ